ncbi:MAG: hypothetical protein Q3965_04175 [Rothia sp. (in: high G+C Gram-positive bacteria)]|nr:hypothetical protein [Rothia sp. (in: high G+C Gram-positive bacteria)]
MPVFASFHGLTTEEIGVWMSLYGLGGLAVFLASTFFNFSPRSLYFGLVTVAGAVLWVSLPGIGLFGFVLAGLGYSLTNAALRTRVNEEIESSGARQEDVWAWVFQYSFLVSGTGFALSSAFYGLGGGYQVLALLLVLGCALFIANIIRFHRSEKRS